MQQLSQTGFMENARNTNTNIEVHFFRGDPGKGQDPWMYSIRDDRGYHRGQSGGATILEAAVKAALDAEQLEGVAARFEALALLDQAMYVISGAYK